MLSLMTSSGMLFLEISLIAFMIQGNNASGVETLTRTFVISGVIVCADLLLKVLIFVKSYKENCEKTQAYPYVAKKKRT